MGKGFGTNKSNQTNIFIIIMKTDMLTENIIDGKTGSTRRVGPSNPLIMAGWVDILNSPKNLSPPNPSRLTRGLRRAGAG